ncbi:hypothetical protein HRbin16_02713 [bacterium HR16]|nr:hypothetical protein HRbin16_02713 [bacterium HR16]
MRISLLLVALVLIPALAFWLNHDTISAVLIIVWTVLVLPIGILTAVDYLRFRRVHAPVVKGALRVIVLIAGIGGIMTTALIWGGILWTLLRFRLDARGLILALGSLTKAGLGTACGLFSWYLVRLALRGEEPFDEGDNEETDEPFAQGDSEAKSPQHNSKITT